MTECFHIFPHTVGNKSGKSMDGSDFNKILMKVWMERRLKYDMKMLFVFLFSFMDWTHVITTGNIEGSRLKTCPSNKVEWKLIAHSTGMTIWLWAR